MKKIRSSISFWLISLLILNLALIVLDMFQPTSSGVTVSEVLFNIFISIFLSWYMCILDYWQEIDHQETIFLNCLQYYYIWLNSFEKSLNEIKENENYLRLYDEYYLRLQVLNNLIKEKNDIDFLEKNRKLFDIIDLTDGLIFYAFDYKMKKYKEDETNAKHFLEATLQAIIEEKSKIDNVMNSLHKCRIKKKWNRYKNNLINKGDEDE